MTELGIGSYALAWAIGVPGYEPEKPLSLEGFLKRVADHGVRLAQIGDNLPLEHLSESDLNALTHLVQELDLSLELGCRGFELSYLLRYLELAEYFRCRLLRVVVDTSTYQPSEREIIDTAQRLLPELEQAEVRLAIENHDRLETQALVRIMESIDSELVGICLDSVNSFGALEGPEIVVKRLAPWVHNLHIKDFRIERLSHNMGFELTGAPAGSGQLRIPWILEQIPHRDPAVNAILELWPPWQGSLEKTITLEELWLKKSLLYLEPLFEGGSD